MYMGNKNSFAIGEWYHCFSRGIDKRVVYQDQADYRHFIDLLFLMNSNKNITIGNLPNEQQTSLLTVDRGTTIVGIGAFVLMPNHYHLLVKETKEGGISRFMQKLGTAYTMYFNTRRERSGGLFTRPFRSRHVSNDRYFQHVVDYIHCNPLDMYKSDWLQTVSISVPVSQKLMTYQHSSLQAFLNRQHRFARIITPEITSVYRPRAFGEMVISARKGEPPRGVTSRR